MEELSKYFRRSEFECECGCGFDTVDVKLFGILTILRHHFNKPITITSGCRCEKHNEKIGGSEKSQHIKGKAADIKVKDIKPLDVYNFLCHVVPKGFGIGLYDSWVHVDSRYDKARWDKREEKE